MKYLSLLSLPLLAAPLFAQTQGPDILLSSSSGQGAYALVDTNKDGKYDAFGETFDYSMAAVDKLDYGYARIGNRIYAGEGVDDVIFWMEDTNKDGQIQDSEKHIFYDAKTNVGATVVTYVAAGKDGWIWWINDGGTGEGIYRSKDLNNDGDAEDAGETIPVLTETMTQIPIENTPLTTAALSGTVRTLSVTEIDSIYYEASYGANGRFLVEDEWTDQTLAFEDKDGDGFFNSKGECYLFCGHYYGTRTTRIDADAHPDMASAKFQSFNEVRAHAVDEVNKVYYLLSGETSATQTDAAIILRGIDNNKDGDVNDAGEVNIFWDGSLDSMGAVKAYNFCYALRHAGNGVLYVRAEFDATTDEEHVLRLEDLNKDGDADDAGECTVLHVLKADQASYDIILLPPGFITLPTRTTLADASYYGSATCASSLSATDVHNIQYGVFGRTRAPTIGNKDFIMRTWGAAPGAPGAYLIGNRQIVAGFPLDAGGTCNIYQSTNVTALFFTTTATGEFNYALPIPASKNLLGLRTFWQSIVVDAGAPAGLGFTVSDAIDLVVGDFHVY